MFVASFEKGASETDAIIGGPPNPELDNEENVISIFVSRVIDPDHPFKTSVRTIFLLENSNHNKTYYALSNNMITL